jgi:hypothetical protein
VVLYICKYFVHLDINMAESVSTVSFALALDNFTNKRTIHVYIPNEYEILNGSVYRVACVILVDFFNSFLCHVYYYFLRVTIYNFSFMNGVRD